MLIVILNTIGIVSLLFYFSYVFFWKTKSVSESLEDDERKTIESLCRGYDKYSWVLLILGIMCFVLADYLGGQSSFLSILKEVFLGKP
jgi:Na+/H+ antiporter NhaD/arsenite permease-like protein